MQIANRPANRSRFVDEILDTDRTRRRVQKIVAGNHPTGLEAAVLLRNPDGALPDVIIQYVGFDVADTFVVGRRLDYDGCHYNLPYIAVLDDERCRDAAADPGDPPCEAIS